VARFYIKRRSYPAAIQRLNGLVEQYPNYRERDAVFYDLGTALAGLGRKAEARLYFERVISEFPKSEYADKAKRRLDQMKTA
jgi:outer membrane protein assembly factor BamD